jgi:hypothetical protein
MEYQVEVPVLAAQQSDTHDISLPGSGHWNYFVF